MSDDLHLFDAARTGNVDALAAALTGNPETLHLRDEPYAWTLLHHAAQQGQLAVVNLLLERGLDPNTLEKGDDTSAMHWAAAAGQLEVVRRLADAGCDVIGHGDDHELEVIGWASCWDGCDDEAHRAVQQFLLSRGARHHIFSAIATGDEAEVRRIVGADPSQLQRRMSRHEAGQLPLHFAVRQNKPQMVRLLIELGADPLGADADGFTSAGYATTPGVDRAITEARRARGQVDLFTALALGDAGAAARIVGADPAAIGRDGVLHIMAKRNDVTAARWLLAHGADPNLTWSHWGALVTPLHLAVLGGHGEMVTLLRQAGASPHIKDSQHDADALEWARFFKRDDLVTLLEA
jgi:hypothetical protein